jgi:dTDP-glucose pyrophosphorylase/CBS domain-containing protein
MKTGRLSEHIWKTAVVSGDLSVRDVIQSMNLSKLGIVLVEDVEKRFVGVVLDGDIRRGFLRGATLDSSVSEVMNLKPVTVGESSGDDLIQQMMIQAAVSHLPVVNEQNQLCGLFVLDRFTEIVTRPNLFVVMAGGRGSRLLPLTLETPKPMLIVNGRPILEHILLRAKTSGFSKFLIATNYLRSLIEDHFEDGSKLAIEIEYLREEEPLGTAGALSLLGVTPELPIVISNADVLSSLDYSRILEFHETSGSVATMAVRLHELQHPFGVVEIDGAEIIGLKEKPVIQSFINAGIYVLSPVVLKFLQPNEYCDMTTLFERLRLAGEKTCAYPLHEVWADVGTLYDLDTARQVEHK